jgi:2-amino-4-hydroxy-6-hydroxymethyldihydropteridine diphosphokinase
MPPRTKPDPRKTLAYVGLGSNLDNPAARVMQAIDALKSLPETRLLKYSSLYGNPPMGPPDQPDYVNAVAELETTLPAHALLRGLQAIEVNMGRVRGGERWGPRIIDLDLLVYGQEQIEQEALSIPHPGIAERAFVLHPLAEIAPDLAIPGLAPVRDLVSRTSSSGLIRLQKHGEN